jgi:CDP-glucose 4,6-dehydratase
MDRKNVVGEAFNFSNELQVSVLDLVGLILDVMKCQGFEPDVRNEATNEIKHQYLSARKAREILDWRPRYDLVQGLGETVNWYRNYLL